MNLVICELRKLAVHLAAGALAGAGTSLHRGATLGLATGVALATAMAPRGVSNGSCPDYSCTIAGRKLRRANG